MDLFHFQDEGPRFPSSGMEKGWRLFQNLINTCAARNDGPLDYDEVNTPDLCLIGAPMRSFWVTGKNSARTCTTNDNSDDRVFD